MQGAAQPPSKDPAVADPSNAALLKEYGFKDFESATYKSDDGRTLKIRAARFADATGAFGAIRSTCSRAWRGRKSEIKARRRDRSRVLFYRGHVVVDAVFNELSVYVGGELARISGRTAAAWEAMAGNLPPISPLMPHHGYQANTEKYAEGPLGP